MPGEGASRFGDLATEVGAGDLVFVPAGTRQRITNIGDADLVFYCVCDPAFEPSCYEQAEP